MMELKWAGGTPVGVTVRLTVVGDASVALHKDSTGLAKVYSGSVGPLIPDSGGTQPASMTWIVPNTEDKLRLMLNWAAESYGKQSKDYSANIEVIPDQGPGLIVVSGSSNPLRIDDQLDANYTDDDSLLIRISK